MFNDDDFQPQSQVQRVGDWFEQRKAYRAAALTALRKREGLPGPVDETGTPLETRFDDLGNAHYYDAQGNKVTKVLFAGAGKDGKPGGFAIGKRKGADLDTASTSWDNPNILFQILEVSEDGKHIEDELLDLHRDAGTYEIAERVSHGAESQMAPDFQLDGTSDEEVDAKLQDYLKRGPK
jgi:hypothetical protein